MRIAVVTSGYPPVVGGLQNVAHNLVLAWRRKGHHVRVFANRNTRDLKRIDLVDGISVRREYCVFRCPGANPIALAKYIIQWLLAPRTIAGLYRAVVSDRPSVVHVHLHISSDMIWYLCLLILFRTVPWVTTIHGLDLDYGRRRRMDRWLTQWFLERCRVITAVSDATAGQLESLFPSCKGHIVAIRNGFDPRPLLAAEPIHRSRPFIACIGRMQGDVKGQDLLIRAFAAIADFFPEWDLVLVGDGSRRKSFEALAAELGVQTRVIFISGTQPRRVYGLLHGCSVLAVPSRYEHFGLVCLEGAYAGKRILASEVGGIPEALKGYPHVVYVAPDCIQALSEGMARVLKEVSDAPKASSAKPNRALAFETWSQVSARYMALFTGGGEVQQ